MLNHYDLYPVQKTPPPKHDFSVAIAIALLIGIIIILCSCSKYTAATAEKQMNKANNTFPGTVAELTRKWYPCITRSSDTVLLTKDSVIYIECPEIIPVPASDYGFAVESGDNLKVELNRPKEVVKYVKVPVTLPVRTQIVTRYIEDSAKIKTLTIAYDGAVKLLEKEKENYAEMKATRNKWRKWCLITWGIIILAVGLRLAIPKIPFLK